MSINFSVMILAAGYGKRMMPLTKEIPKPLLDINGITLLGNSINFIQKLGFNKIIINTHYRHLKINEFINNRKDKESITLINENVILDTGGAVKNAKKYFENEHILIINSDIFWQKENIKDVKKLIADYSNNLTPNLLLAKKNNAYGIKKKKGDFVLEKNNIIRSKMGDEIFFYSGLQIINLKIFNEFKNFKFSFNDVWDLLIYKKMLTGTIMRSNWYHVGDIHGLRIARQLIP